MNLEIKSYVETIPAVKDAANLKETFWQNHKRLGEAIEEHPEVTLVQIEDARETLERFAPYIAKAFPETTETKGIIESPLKEISKMSEHLNEVYDADIKGRLLLKMDSHLPIAGSIKARGGIYEILKHAEELALAEGLLKETDDYSILDNPEFREFFSKYTIQVGSTGNLGMSIGIISAKLGFNVIVHMSSDAKEWKKDLLKSKGVLVKEYPTDYSEAVEKGRKDSDLDPMSYFVDDENSIHLFLGYSVAGKRVKKQLDEASIIVDDEHPLFVYLPCGIGGAPGGVAYGLEKIFGKNVHCFFTEPTEACCMLLGMATGKHDAVSVQDFGISGKTDADGLAVGRSSAFVGQVVDPMLGGIFTIEDYRLYDLMRALLETEDIFIEPSACAAFAGLIRGDDMKKYIKDNGLDQVIDNATHIAWATGGSMVPEETIDIYLKTNL